MRYRTGETLAALLGERILTDDVRDLRVDVRKDSRIHLVPDCSRKAVPVDVRVEELLKATCPSCGTEWNLTSDWTGQNPPSRERRHLHHLIERGRALRGMREMLADTRERTPVERAKHAAGIAHRAQRDEWPGELAAAAAELVTQAHQKVQEHLEASRLSGRVEELRRQVEPWWTAGEDCLLGLPRWWQGYVRGRDAEALELLVAFSVPHPDPAVVLSRVPGWASEFLIDRLGGRAELEMAEDTDLTTGEQEVLVALWPGMPLLEAVESAKALA